MTGPESSAPSSDPSDGSAPVGSSDALSSDAPTGDVVTEDAGAPTSEGATSKAASSRRDRSRLALYAGTAALVLLLVGAVVLALQLRSQSQEDAAREAALSAARQSALNLTSIDQTDFEDDVAAVLDGATGEFRSDFAARADDLERLLKENEVVAEGKVLESALVRSDRTSATALVVVDSTVSNTATPDGRVNSYRIKLELEKVGDRWLTSVLEFVG